MIFQRMNVFLSKVLKSQMFARPSFTPESICGEIHPRIKLVPELGGVYKRKLTLMPASHRDDYLILYCVYMIYAARRNGPHFSLSSTMPSLIEKNYVCTSYLFQSTERPIQYKKEWLFFAYGTIMIFHIRMILALAQQLQGWIRSGTAFSGGIM